MVSKNNSPKHDRSGRTSKLRALLDPDTKEFSIDKQREKTEYQAISPTKKSEMVMNNAS